MVKIRYETQFGLYVEDLNSKCVRAGRRKKKINASRLFFQKKEDIKKKWKYNRREKKNSISQYEKQVRNFSSEKPNQSLDISMVVGDENIYDRMDYEMRRLPFEATSKIQIPDVSKKIYGVSDQDSQKIYHVFGNELNYEYLGKLYHQFKKKYMLIEMAVILDLFDNDINKARYAIAVNLNQDKIETLYETALRVSEERGLNEYSRRFKRLRKEEPKPVCNLNEMKDGKVSEDGLSFIKYFRRDIREDEKRVNREKDWNLEKELGDAGMHIIH